MKKLLLRSVSVALALLALGTTVKAQHGSGPGGGGSSGPTTYPVTFNPITEIANGPEPFTLTTIVSTTPLVTSPGYYLQVVGPNDPTTSDYPMTVTFSISVLQIPANALVDTALSYVNIYSADATGNFNLTVPGIPGLIGGGIPALPGGIGASATLVFTGPSQVQQLYITEQIPLGNYAGTYLYQISGTGWVSNATSKVVEYGANNTAGHPTINSVVSVTQTSPPPTVKINAPADESKYYIYPFSANLSPTVTIPITAEGDIPTGASPVTGVNIFWGDTSTLLTNATFTKDSPAAGEAIATTSSPVISAPGTYLITAQSTNDGGTSGYATVAVNVYSVPAPGIKINGPANGAVFIIPASATSLALPYSITGNGSLVADGSKFGIVSASASLVNNATSLTVGGFAPSFPGVPGAMATTAAGNLPALAAGSYTINAIDSNSPGTAADTVTFTLVQAVPPTISITTPANNAVYTTGLLGLATVPYTIVGATTNGASDAVATASATLTSGGLPVLSFLPLFPGVGVSASVTSTGSVQLPAGTYTLTAQDTNNYGGSATATPVTFTVVGPPVIAITGISPTYSAGSNGLATVNFAINGSTPLGSLFNSTGNASATLTGPNGVVATFGPSFSIGLLGLSIGTGNSSISLPPGTYTMTATEVNTLGGTASATPVTFTILAGPTVGISSPANGAVFSTLSGKASVPYTITGTTPTGTAFTSASGNTASLTASNGGSTAGVTQPAFTGFGSGVTTIAAGGTFSLQPGTYTIAASDTNNLGGTATATPVTFTVVGPPTVAIATPLAGAVFSVGSGGTAAVTYTINGGTPAGTAFSSASGNVATLTASGTGSVSGVTQPAFTGYGGTSVTITATGTFNLIPGTYTLAANDSNNLNGTATAIPVTFTVVGLPTVVINPPVNGTIYNVGTSGKASVPYTITGSTPAGTAFTTASGNTATLTASNGGSTTGVTQPAFTGFGTGVTTITAGGTFSLQPGTYTIAASDANNAGGAATAIPVTFTVVGLPTAVISPPGAGAVYTVDGTGKATVPYTITGTTPTGTAFVTSTGDTAVLTASGSGSITGVTQPTFTGFGAASTTITATGAFSLAPGTYTLAASDTNNSGGMATAIPVTFTVVGAPAISINPPTNGATYTAGSNGTAAVAYVINGTTPTGTLFTATNSGTTAALAATSGGSLTGVTQPVFTGFGATSTSIVASGTFNLIPGTYTITAKDQNNVGGTATATPVTFTVTGAPTVVINPPVNGTSYPVGTNGTASVPYTILGSTPAGTAFSAASGNTATLTASNGGSTSGVTQPAFPGAGFTASATSITASGTFTLTPGTYTLNATVTNGSGGTATATAVTFTVTSAATCTTPTLINASNFNGTPISQGRTIWFNSVVNVTGLSGKAGIVQFTNATIAFTSGGSPVSLIAPSATITFSATATTATTVYDAPSNTWQTTVPVGYSGNVFLSGLAYPVPANFPTGLNPVTWSGGFLSDVQNVGVQWQWAAAVYTQFASDLNSAGIKPIEGSTGNNYHNSDHAGTPETETYYVTGGARGGGGSNYTGSYSGTVSSSSSGTTGIPGLYASGVSSSGSLLAGGATDSHYVVTASSMGSQYTGNSYVDPASLAAGWVPNTSTAQWITAPGGVNIGNGGGNNGLPSSGSTARTDTYDYTLTFTMPAGATLSTASIVGTLSADDTVMVIVNGAQVTSGVPNIADNEYNQTSPFTLNSSNATFQAGTNTITFRVANENTPTPKNASGLFIQSIGGTVTVTQGQGAVTYCPAIDNGHTTQGNGNPPTVTPTSPATGSTYPYISGCSGASVPVAFTATSPTGSGNITAIAATLDGNPITLGTTTGVGSAATASGSATLTVSTVGTHTLVYTGTNAYGTATQSVTFTVTAVKPPTIALGTPSSCNTVIIASGSTTAQVPYSFTGGTTAGTVDSVTVTVNGAAVSPAATVNGLGSNAITGSGTLTLAAGTYTLVVNDSNVAGSASDQVTFSVALSQSCGGGQGSDSGAEALVWLQANSCGQDYNCGENNSCSQTVTGGSVVPILFALYGSSHNWCDGWDGSWDGSCNNNNFITDTGAVIAVTEVYSNGSSSTPVIYAYGANGPNPPYFSINNSQYLLYFPTASGSHHYSVEVYHPLSSGGAPLQILGSEDLYTQNSCMPSTAGASCSFNNSSISSGRCLWFSSVLNVSGLSNQATTLVFDSSTVNFTLGRTPCSLVAPGASIKFDPNCSTASTTYNAATNCWVTVVPVGYTGNVFLTGVNYTVPSGFPTSLSPVTWNGNFRSDNNNCSARWQWSAAAYTQCSSNPNSLGVKAVDSSSLCSYRNSDHAGTPENYKGYVTSGGCGTGGSNYTGNYCSQQAPSVGTNCWLDSSWSGQTWSGCTWGNNSWGGNNWGSNSGWSWDR